MPKRMMFMNNKNLIDLILTIHILLKKMRKIKFLYIKTNIIYLEKIKSNGIFKAMIQKYLLKIMKKIN